jgi:aspartate/methionine/tyrosine aminotransferase
MQFPPFKLERYFAKYEFKVKYLLSPSDCEALSQRELVQMADADGRALWDSLSLCYTESAGHPLLRAEVSKLYSSIHPDDVMIAAPEEAILIAMHSLLQPNDHVVALFPAYQSLYEIPRSRGCDVTMWRLRADEHAWRLDINQLESMLTDKTRLLILNFPHNPTGYLPLREDLDAIVELARDRGIYIFSDEMYRMLEYDPTHRLPAMCDLYDKGISLSGLSKVFALPGLRIGWLATQDKALLERALAFKDYTTICSSAPSEVLAIIALRAKEGIVARNLSIIQSNWKCAESFFADHSDRFTWLPPQAGSIAFPRWTGGTSIDQLCQDLLEKRGVMIVPGSIFEFPGNHFRLGLGRKNFAEALTQVGEYLGA